MKTRSYPADQPEKWERYKDYCRQDVEAEREVTRLLSKYKYPESERQHYILDQKINDRGILVDLVMAKNAFDIDERFSSELYEQTKAITGLDNPNSPAQLKKWLSDRTGKNITSLAKGDIPAMIEATTSFDVQRVLELQSLRECRPWLKRLYFYLFCHLTTF